jgi:hypothetical protein
MHICSHPVFIFFNKYFHWDFHTDKSQGNTLIYGGVKSLVAATELKCMNPNTCQTETVVFAAQLIGVLDL